MLDIKFLRTNPDIVKENIKKKFQFEKIELVDKVIELEEARETQSQSKSVCLWQRVKRTMPKMQSNRLRI